MARPDGERERQLALQIRSLAAAGLGRVEGSEGAGALLEGVLRDARARCVCAGAALYLREEEELCLLLASYEGVSGAALSARRDARLPRDETTPAGFAASSGQAFETADAYTLTGRPGFDAANDLEGFRTKALLALPVLDRDGELTGVLELVNPQDGTFSEEVRQTAASLLPTASAALEAERVERGHLESVFQLARSVEAGDPEIDLHVRRVSGYSAALADAAGCNAATVRWIRLASPLHDIGKVGIAREILYKPGKLSDEEFEITKEHCQRGHALLQGVSDSPLFELAAQVAYCHHERYDGKGYPRGLSKRKIPLAGRIVAVADVFDALTTRRSYKPAMGIEQSLKIIRQEAGRHFDPDLVDAFQAIFSQILDVKGRYNPD